MKPAATLLLPLLTVAAGAAPKPGVPQPEAVSGHVLANGKPAAGCRVFLYWAEPTSRGWRETKAGPKGEFRFALKARLRADLAVTAVDSTGACAWTAIRSFRQAPPKAGPAPVKLSLLPPVVLTGSVVTGAGAPAVDQPLLIGAVRPQSGIWPEGAELLPPAILSGLGAKTGPDGRFRIGGMPPGTTAALLRPQGERALPLQVTVGSAPEQPVGILVDRRTGILNIDALWAGKPAAGGALWLRRRPAQAADPIAAVLARRSGRSEAAFRSLLLDKQGRAAENLPPGEYELAFHGRLQTVQVGADAETTVRFESRAHTLKGTVRGADGKPSEARLAVAVTEPALPTPVEFRAADRMGTFELPDFPWEAERVTIRAISGTAEAVWTGSPRDVREPLVLTLAPVPVLEVRGRIVHEGKPLPQARVALFQRDAAGMARALAAGISDAEGRFLIKGLRRGVVFQVGTIQNRPEQEPRVLESKPVPAPDSGETLELGEVALDPYEPASERELQARSYLPAAMPVPADETAAGDALFRYLEALRRGDVRSAHGLTSTLEPAYVPVLPGFLESADLALPGSLASIRRDQLHAVRVFPRLLLAGMYDSGSDAGLPELLEAMRKPEWVLFAHRSGENIRRVGLMHREGGGWKLLGGLATDETGTLNAAAGDHALFGVPYPPAEGGPLGAAAAAYWRSWAASDEAQRKTLTVAGAPPAARPPQASVPQLTPETRFSEWDLSVLFRYPHLVHALRTGAASAPRADLQGFPYPHIRSRDLGVLSYTVAEQERYLMLLVREKGEWRVLDPALPVGSPADSPSTRSTGEGAGG